ncbi:MAG: hypothetical protein DI538_29335, partial [Azospira oryzae]
MASASVREAGPYFKRGAFNETSKTHCGLSRRSPGHRRPVGRLCRRGRVLAGCDEAPQPVP